MPAQSAKKIHAADSTHVMLESPKSFAKQLEVIFPEAYLHLASRLSQIMASAPPDAGAPSLAYS